MSGRQQPKKRHRPVEKGKPVDSFCSHKPKCQSWREHKAKPPQ